MGGDASDQVTPEERKRFLDDLLPSAPGGKGKAPRLPPDLGRTAIRGLTRCVLATGSELLDASPHEAAAVLETTTALYLGQAAMWAAVSRLLGGAGKMTDEQVDRVMVYFLIVYTTECAPEATARHSLQNCRLVKAIGRPIHASLCANVGRGARECSSTA